MTEKELNDMSEEKLFDTIGGANDLYSKKASAVLFKKYVNNLLDALNKNSNSSNKLSKRVLFLNFIMTIAAIIGVWIGYLQFIKH